jgi:hypothetical protein
MCPILDGYGVTSIYKFPYTPWREPLLTDQLAGVVISLVGYHLRCKHNFFQLTRAVHNRVAACFTTGGGIFEKEL